MRFKHAVLAGAGVLIAAIGIVAGGARIAPPEPTFQADPADLSDADLATPPDATEDDADAPQSGTDVPAAPEEPGQDAAVAPSADEAKPLAEAPAPPQAEQEGVGELKRLPDQPVSIEPAAGQTAEAKTPKAAAPETWKSTRLFKPVAASAGTIEAQGYRVALAGIEPLPPEEKCEDGGKEWACGLAARTAFRSWLRGRAVACTVPPQPDEQAIVADCTLGKTDIAEWLVSNGWAKPAPAGLYVAAGQKAAEARKGIYGPAPVQGLDLPRVADPAPMELPATEPAPEELLPAAPAQPPLGGAFPPPPPSPPQ